MVWHGNRRDDGGGGTVDRVAVRHDATMPRVGVVVRGVVCIDARRRRRYRVSHARRVFQFPIRLVHAAHQSGAAVELDRGERMPRGIQLVEAFSTAVAAVRERESIEGTRGDVDRDDTDVDRGRISSTNRYRLSGD